MPEYRTPRDSQENYREDGYRRPVKQQRRPQSAPQNRRPAPRKRKKKVNLRLLAVLAVLVVIVVVLVVIISGGSKNPGKPQATPTPPPQTGALTNATIHSATNAPSATAASAVVSALAATLGDEDAVLQPLPEEDRVQVSDLSLNTSLPDDWLNILLLGTDERSLNEAARTDTMIICSIHKETHKVKLTSIMRDIAVSYDDLDEHNGTYRINAANYFGGPEYAMKIVNECFGMNIEYYATVNFFGFQKIAQALGGITMDITKEEMDQINKYAVKQAKAAYAAGIDESDQINEYLTVYGEDTPLNGRQTLAYARIRKIDSDFSRAERQRKVLVALMNKLKERSATEIIALGLSMFEHVTTNMDFETVIGIAVDVLGSDFKDVESFRLPIADSYKQETRNEESMFYDCDWETNARELQNFIYS